VGHREGDAMICRGWRGWAAVRRGALVAGALAALTLSLIAADIGRPVPGGAPVAAGTVIHHRGAAPMVTGVTPTPTPHP
jgi:hypothetical protein